MAGGRLFKARAAAMGNTVTNTHSLGLSNDSAHSNGKQIIRRQAN